MDSQNKESYQVLARKYRPQNFDELVGQDVLVKTISNYINNKKIPHAIVLTGIRGVGKTTTARIIAKSLNCIGKEGLDKDARIPCNECENCLAITNSRFQDVIEVDAASKTGVDDIRSIIDSISYAPAIGRCKVYIIDEVHMLSNNAFNALLKTLEEPPSYVKFIFATTEIKKIPVTILSRCQRFDLRRLNEDELEKFLEKILTKENFDFEEGSLKIIAGLSQGSARDALSLTDQLLSLNNYQKNIPKSIVETLIRSSDKLTALELFESLLKGDIKKSIEVFNEYYDRSSDIIALNQDLIEITHKITLCKTLGDIKYFDLSSSQIDKIKEISEVILLSDLIKFWQILLKGLNEISSFKVNQKISFEMLLIRICYLKDLPNFEAVINQDKEFKDSNIKSTESAESNKNFSAEILRNFSGSKVVS